MKLNIENENTFRNALSEGFNLFLGAGFSCLAEDEHGDEIPIGSKLHEELIHRFSLDNLANLPLDKLATVIKKQNREELERYLRSRFTIGNFDKKYFYITKLPVRGIFTTNIDDLVSKIFSKSKSRYLQDVSINGAADDALALNYVPLHGSISNMGQQLYFSTTELASASARRAGPAKRSQGLN